MRKFIIFWKYGLNIRLSTYKNLEIEFSKINWIWFQIFIEWTKRNMVDHWGLTFEIIILGFGVDLKLYDSRHAKEE